MTTLKDAKIGDHISVWLDQHCKISETKTAFWSLDATVIGTDDEDDPLIDIDEQQTLSSSALPNARNESESSLISYTWTASIKSPWFVR